MKEDIKNGSSDSDSNNQDSDHESVDGGESQMANGGEYQRLNIKGGDFTTSLKAYQHDAQ